MGSSSSRRSKLIIHSSRRLCDTEEILFISKGTPRVQLGIRAMPRCEEKKNNSDKTFRDSSSSKGLISVSFVYSADQDRAAQLFYFPCPRPGATPGSPSSHYTKEKELHHDGRIFFFSFYDYRSWMWKMSAVWCVCCFLFHRFQRNDLITSLHFSRKVALNYDGDSLGSCCMQNGESHGRLTAAGRTDVYATDDQTRMGTCDGGQMAEGRLAHFPARGTFTRNTISD